MDPITQGALGAILPASMKVKWLKNSKYHVALAGFFGMIGGIAADLDVLIYSNTDPLLFLKFHRQFTHSLLFIPFGGFMVALLVHSILGRRWKLRFWETTILCSLGYATHAILDAATSYGTMLLWPFTEIRYSWNIISIVDPLYSLPLILLVSIAAGLNKPYFARIGLVWAIFYLGLGWWQNQVAHETAKNLAASRGHLPDQIVVKPSFGNILVWKSIYEVDEQFFVDSMRVGIASQVYEGASISKLNLERDFPWLKKKSQQAKDIKRFDHFSNGYSAVDPSDSNRIIDIRYSFVPNEISALFSIELAQDAGSEKHVRYKFHRNHARKNFSQLWQMIVD